MGQFWLEVSIKILYRNRSVWVSVAPTWIGLGLSLTGFKRLD